MTVQCFISHSWQDNEHTFALKLAETLRLRGISVWLDETKIPSGSYIKEQVIRGIKGCDIFLFVMSPAAITSPWCRAELDEALRLHSETCIQIIPILLKSCSIPETLRHLLYTDFCDKASFTSSLERLITSIGKLYPIRVAVKELLEGDDEMRFQAAQKLAVLKDRCAVSILARCLLSEPDPTVRYWLAHALGQIDEENAYLALQKAEERETDPFAKQGIQEALSIATRRLQDGKEGSINT